MINFKSLLNLNIGKKIFIVFLIAILLPTILGSVLSYRTFVNSSREELLEDSKSNVDTLSIIVDRVVKPVMYDTDVLSREFSSMANLRQMEHNAELNLDSNEEVQAALKRFKAVHTDDTEIIGVALDDGLFAMEPQSKLAQDFDARTRVWYTKAMENKGKVVISDPYVSAGSGNVVVSIAKTTLDNKGVAVVNLSLKQYLTDTVNQQRIGDQGFAFILDGTQKVLTHPTIAAGEVYADEKALNQMFASESGIVRTKVDGKDAELIYTTNALTGWKIIGVLYDSEVDALKWPIIKTTALVVVLAILILVAVVVLVNRMFIRPIKQMTAVAKDLAQGNLQEANIQIRTKDELSELASAFTTLIKEFRSLIGNLSGGINDLYHSADVLNSEIDKVSSASVKIYSTNGRVTENSVAQATSTEEISRAVQESAAGISSIAESASEINDISDETYQKAQSGSESVQATVNQMSSIDHALTSYSEVIQSLMDKAMEIEKFAAIINGIATETSLLSLNASIEAARAGEHGKGFAVVANEVKKLSAQSSEASKQITELIKAIGEETTISIESLMKVKNEVKEGIALSDNVDVLFSGIMENMSKLNDEIQNLSAISQEIAAGSEQISSSTESLSHMSNNNAAESRNALESIEQQQQSLKQLQEQVSVVLQTAETTKDSVQKFKL
ncbi:methyl-accepting chemotaxis protein [Paenibacillus thailandensis]|uniref:Methyl-accepting chemotaxis protein n=1 Tax=Paenibacillus thailandensis TaxID=393250 RepID=A0ABW5R303_9BACL